MICKLRYCNRCKPNGTNCHIGSLELSWKLTNCQQYYLFTGMWQTDGRTPSHFLLHFFVFVLYCYHVMVNKVLYSIYHASIASRSNKLISNFTWVLEFLSGFANVINAVIVCVWNCLKLFTLLLVFNLLCWLLMGYSTSCWVPLAVLDRNLPQIILFQLNNLADFNLLILSKSTVIVIFYFFSYLTSSINTH